jgi:hypothetical protein
LRNGLVIALGVGIGDPRGFVVRSNESRHVALGIKIRAARDQPQGGGEVRRMRPARLGQR